MSVLLLDSSFNPVDFGFEQKISNAVQDVFNPPIVSPNDVFDITTSVNISKLTLYNLNFFQFKYCAIYLGTDVIILPRLPETEE